MNEQELSQALMGLLKNKKEVLAAITESLTVCRANQQAFDKLLHLLEQGKEVDSKKVFIACAKSLEHTNKTMQQLLSIAIVYAASSEFDSSIGRMLNNLGYGQDALLEILRQKMGG
jgi:hypothetical protein